MLAGVLFGCFPAWRASGVRLNETLKEGGRSGSSRGHNRLRQALVVTEFGLALTLLAAAGLVIHSFWNLSRVDLGVRTDHILTFSLPLANSRFADSKQTVNFYRQLLEKTQALPGVLHAPGASERAAHARELVKSGVQVLEADAESLSLAVINRYMSIKRRQMV